MERLLGSHAALSVGFADGDLRRRVGALLDETAFARPTGALPGFVFGGLMLAVAHVDAVHHAVESFVALLV